MQDIIKTKFENEDMKKLIALFAKSLNRTKGIKNPSVNLTFQDGFDHAMNMVSDSFKTFLEGYNEP